MKRRKVCLYAQLLVLLVIGFRLPAHAIIYVSKTGLDTNDGLTWAASKLTIQNGITTAAASADPTVWVAVGTLPPPLSPLQPTAVPYVENLTVPDSVAVYGGFRGDEAESAPPPVRTLSTIVQPPALSATTPIFTAGSGDIIDGFTIENGQADTGAGIRCTGTSCTISNDIIQDNSGRLGAGVYATGTSLTVRDCQFSDNQVTDASGALAAGAGIYATGGSLTIQHTTFTNQTASVTTTSGNSSQGGAIYSTGATLVRLDRCVFDGCITNGTQQIVLASGGGAYVTGALTYVTNCLFHACAAHGQGNATQPAFGGAIYYHNAGLISIINNTFVGNAVTPQAGLITDIDRPYGLGGAIYLVGAGSTAKIWNNIIADTRGTAVVNDNISPMIVSFNYNLLWHNAGGDIYGFNFPSMATDKDVMKDPQFLLGDPLFHITYGSPAKDTGSNSGAPGFDIDGEVRPFNVIVDIGADEFVDSDDDGGADTNPLETSPLLITGAETDTDLDGITIPYDNCPINANPSQIDSNGDGIGDVCEGIPEVFYVDAAAAPGGDGLSWGTAFQTIQEGIDAADLHNQTSMDGATPWAGVNPAVWVKAGTYNENILIWHGVQVYGGFDGTEDPPSVNPDVLSGRTPLTNVSEINGGALWSTVVIAHLPQDRFLTGTVKTLYDTIVPTLDGFLVTNGTAEIGGGVSVYKESANVSSNRINVNTAALGGGIYFFKSFGWVGDGIGPPPGNVLTGDTTINGNTATGLLSYAGYGGGIYTEQGGPLVFANIIEGNTAYYGGGAASRKSSPMFVENLIGCQTSPNTAAIPAGSGLGGGVYLDQKSWAAFEKDTIVSNTATGAASQGGGLYFNDSDFYMNLTIMAFNTATFGQEIWGNSPTAQVVLYPLCYITLSDFWPVVASEFVGITDPTVDLPPPPPIVPCATTTNFAVDPLFVDPSTCDYHLQATSPLRLESGEVVGAFQDEDPPVSISGAKLLANGVVAEISGVVVTAVFPDGFYIEDADRISGMKVIMSNPSVSEGQIVNVTGTVTTLNEERQLINASVSTLLGASMSLGPVGMPNLMVGGGPVLGWTSCVSEGVGLSNIGLLVRTWGKVTQAGTSPSRYFVLDDGSRVGVKVRVPSGSTLPAIGVVVSAAGISTSELDAKGNRCRVIRARRASDIAPRQ